jgi:two-component system chemotaxis response regulator CheY
VPEVNKPLKLLIVDDSAVMRAMIRRAVLLSGAAVETIHDAPNGAAALTMLETYPIDVVFTDINMPVMNGVQLLQEIAARGWSHLVRVVISTDGSLARRDEVAGLGVQLVVEKPFAPEAIRNALNISD